MSAIMVNTNVMAKVVTAILLNFDTFDGGSTARGARCPDRCAKGGRNKHRQKALHT